MCPGYQYRRMYSVGIRTTSPWKKTGAHLNPGAAVWEKNVYIAGLAVDLMAFIRTGELTFRDKHGLFTSNPSPSKIAALESKINELKADRAGPKNNNNSTSARSSSLADGDAAPEEIINRHFLDVDTAERYLSTFKTKLTPHFPFVVVPPDVSFKQLHQEKPFLCLAILASASYENMPLQRALGDEVKKVVASRMVIGGEISFELLQGLLVFLAW
ncbi:uncharacterized protein N7518_007493 [Penicillium psychrosexuale]|uniref:uncharacterized protein n=1 Tax=Penicillium psychrosexuale TaxID=1002107 RepID=UPI0025456317|nr:uncharacterized protein N7518_007493 [Penicillium psychrosexuale]KAJ5790482.1 hypothetical protein N7518_007493 [Penicillium psychrosexuale]